MIILCEVNNSKDRAKCCRLPKLLLDFKKIAITATRNTEQSTRHKKQSKWQQQHQQQQVNQDRRQQQQPQEVKGNTSETNRQTNRTITISQYPALTLDRRNR